jgi:hypothetical protein
VAFLQGALEFLQPVGDVVACFGGDITSLEDEHGDPDQDAKKYKLPQQTAPHLHPHQKAPVEICPIIIVLEVHLMRIHR